jgi:N utilization substance protein A
MNALEVTRIVDTIHRDKGIDKEVVFTGIEQAILTALRKHYGEEDQLDVKINRTTGEPTVIHNGVVLEPDILGRIAAQTAKQVMIQKIREAERDNLIEEYSELATQIVSGSIVRFESGMAYVSLGKVEAVLPRSEQIPGESHRVGERIRAVVTEVKKAGSRIKIILSRTHVNFVRRLFESEIPEVAERVIDIRSLAREPGRRSKVAVSCIDSNIDCKGACIGVRGARIKTIIDELGGERIDIVRWNDSLQVLIPSSLEPAVVEDVILCPMLGRVITLVREDQLSLAIGKNGQNVRLASKLVGWDIEVMTREELDEQLERSVAAFSQVTHMSEELAENLVSQGFFSFDDLSIIEPTELATLGNLSEDEVDEIIAFADQESMRLEEEEKQKRSDSRSREPRSGRGGDSRGPSAGQPVETITEAPVKTEEAAPEVSSEASSEEAPPTIGTL